MRRSLLTVALFAFTAWNAHAQVIYPYYIQHVAGSFPLGDGGPASSALLFAPQAAVADATGNLYILDSKNFRIRKVAPNGTISTFATLSYYGYDMKLGPDGQSLYIGGAGVLQKITLGGIITKVAGTGTSGFSGDGGAAVNAQIGSVSGLAFSPSGVLFFSDVGVGHRIRSIGLDGVIRTVAGTSSFGYNGDNQPASAASFFLPYGLAVDRSGNIFVADFGNGRVRRFTVGGNITTVISGLVLPQGLAIDSADTLYVTDLALNIVLKLTANGFLSLLAGDNSISGVPKDGFANNSSIDRPVNVSANAAGDLFLVEGSHVVRKLSQGVLTTVAGRLHYGGDNGLALNALLNEPHDLTLDGKGNLLIADANSFLLRKVANGTITTYGGKPFQEGRPLDGVSIASATLPYITAMTSDGAGTLYFSSRSRVYKVDPAGVITAIAGSPTVFGNAGDGGPALSATFNSIAGLAVSPFGDVYVADSAYHRVRKIAAGSSIVTAVAGNHGAGFGGDGGPATAATLYLNSRSPLAVDSTGNLYISDYYNYRVRKVDASGTITTVVGNGRFGRPADGDTALSPFSTPNGLAVDAAGRIYIASYDYQDVYLVANGVVRRILGGTLYTRDPGLGPFFAWGLSVDGNGDVYAADPNNNAVRRLVPNSPVSVTVQDGDAQTGAPGSALAKPLKVLVLGRANAGVSGVSVAFAVTQGNASLGGTTSSTASAVTDASGVATISVALGSTSGPLTITATVAGLTPARFTATATPGASGCSVPQPVVTSVASAGDFGGGSSFASGSWLEIKGRNLSSSSRSWAGADFNGPAAPTSLDGVTVTIAGVRAFVSYISPAQINVQAPAITGAGQMSLVVTSGGCSSAAVSVQKAAVAPGLLAPAAFRVAGRQYAAATHSDGYTFVGAPGLIAGAAFRPAAVGETITAYGIGFGDVVPAIAPGTVASAANSVPNLSISFGTTEARVTYAGLAPGIIGLYQFNIVVPNLASGDYPINIRVGSTTMSQTAYLTVGSTTPAPPLGPNVGITLDEIAPVSPVVGDNLTFWETITNPSRFSGDLLTRLYFSTTPTISASSALVSAGGILTLTGNAGGFIWRPVSMPEGIKPGNYYVAIGVMTPDNTNPQAITFSNTVPIQIAAARQPFDVSVTLKDVTRTVAAGDPIDVDYVVTEPAGFSGTLTRSIYISTRPNVTTSDTLVNTRTVDVLKGSADLTSAGNSLPRTLTPGTYYVAVFVETTGDRNPANNLSASLPITVTATRNSFDLGVQVSAVTPAAITQGGSFTVTYDVKNTSRSTGIYTRSVYLSSDRTLTSAGVLLSSGTFSITGQDGRATTSAITMPATTAAGQYYIIVSIESEGDTNPADNVSNAFPVQVVRAFQNTFTAAPSVASTSNDDSAGISDSPQPEIRSGHRRIGLAR